MHEELSPAALAYRYRMTGATIGENGKRFHPECPPKRHGSSTGYNYWGCRCDPCIAYGRSAARGTYQRAKYNKLILMMLQSKRSDPDLPAVPEDAAEAAPPSAEAGVGNDAEPLRRPPERVSPLESFSAIYRKRFHRGA